MEARGQPQSPAANRMSQGDSNPAATPHIAEDVQGDGRWMSQHSRFVLDCKDKEPDVLFVGDSMVQLLQQYEVLCAALEDFPGFLRKSTAGRI